MTLHWLTTRNVIKATLALHLLALLALPKDLWASSIFRPEDVTGIALIALCIGLALATLIALPSGPVPLVAAGYFAYLLAVVITRDALRGYPEAFVFWFKEVSYLCFGYLVWRVYRSEPWQFVALALLMTVPNLAYGALQVVAGPSGLYGLAPFGHQRSPASAGMIYMTYAWLLFIACLLKPGSNLYRFGLVLSGVFVVASGSKLAVLGAASLMGWYLLQELWRKRSARALARLAGFSVTVVIGLTAATVLGYMDGSSWGALGRYRGLLSPVAVMVERGIWWKIKWVDTWLAAIVGAGYSPSHLVEGRFDGYGMAMDNQLLFFVITGGVFGTLLYGLLLVTIYRALPASSTAGMIARSLVVAYVVMGLGGEVLQLSVAGNAFWMMLGLCFALDWSRRTGGAHDPNKAVASLATPAAAVAPG